jgi:protocatechuate 3,4-dioxygenase beta subunit
VGRLPHIHIRVVAPEHEELITQHYPKAGNSSADFDMILERVTEKARGF